MILETFVVAGALRDGLVKPSTRYDCEGGRWKVGGRWISEADKKHSFKWLSVTEILANSSNIGAAKIGFDLGGERLYQTLADFGFIGKSGISLPGEARGIINPLPWRPHLLSNVAFGHGIAVTPIQLISAYGAVANGGILRRPLLVKSIRSGDDVEEFKAQDIRRVLSPQDAATLRLMLTAATEEKSTGHHARIPGYYVAGKTGTAQKVDAQKGGYIPNTYISSFAGFVPAHDPRYVIYVAVDSPKKIYYGSEVAAPVFSKVAQYLVRRAGLPPVLISERNVIQPSKIQNRALRDIRRSMAESKEGFPNLVGLTLREAMAVLKPHAEQVDVRGHGMVVKTIPSAGLKINGQAKVTLILENPGRNTQ